MVDFLLNTYDTIFYFAIPIVEIAILTIIFYYILQYLRGTRGASVLAGFVFIAIILTILADFLSFEVLSWLLNGLWTFMAIALVVIFQPELRRALSQIGARGVFRKQKREEAINEIITAVINLSKRKHGALIVLEQNIGMRGIAENSIMVEARLSHRLLEAIFWPNSPLHDGGVIIRGGMIVAASCIFPLSVNNELIGGLGTRHRAGLGITEETDALVVIVSEEKGYISVAYKGNMKRNISHDRLRRFMGSLVDRERSLIFKDVVSDLSELEESQQQSYEEKIN